MPWSPFGDRRWCRTPSPRTSTTPDRDLAQPHGAARAPVRPQRLDEVRVERARQGPGRRRAARPRCARRTRGGCWARRPRPPGATRAGRSATRATRSRYAPSVVGLVGEGGDRGLGAGREGGDGDARRRPRGSAPAARRARRGDGPPSPRRGSVRRGSRPGRACGQLRRARSGARSCPQDRTRRPAPPRGRTRSAGKRSLPRERMTEPPQLHGRSCRAHARRVTTVGGAHRLGAATGGPADRPRDARPPRHVRARRSGTSAVFGALDGRRQPGARRGDRPGRRPGARGLRRRRGTAIWLAGPRARAGRA